MDQLNSNTLTERIIEYIKTKFIGERVFFLPFQWLINKIHDDSMASFIIPTCPGNLCTFEKTTNCKTCDFPCYQHREWFWKTEGSDTVCAGYTLCICTYGPPTEFCCK